jgi:hypothetical protein
MRNPRTAGLRSSDAQFTGRWTPNPTRDSGIDSTTSGREKTVPLASRGIEYLAAQREATRNIDAQLRAELGEVSFASL